MNKKITNQSNNTVLTNMQNTSTVMKTNEDKTNKAIFFICFCFFMTSILTQSFQVVRFFIDDSYSIVGAIHALIKSNKIEASIFLIIFIIAMPILNLIILINLDRQESKKTKLLASIIFKCRFIPVIFIILSLLIVELGFFGKIKILKGFYMYAIYVLVMSYLNWRLIPKALTHNIQQENLEKIETYKTKIKKTINRIFKFSSILIILMLVVKIATPFIAPYLNEAATNPAKSTLDTSSHDSLLPTSATEQQIDKSNDYSSGLISKSVSFENCLEALRGTSTKLAVAPINIVETTDMRMVKFPTKDGPVIVTCDRARQKMSMSDPRSVVA